MTPYYRVTNLDDAIRAIAELSARTAIVDVEPLVAYWNTGRPELRAGVTSTVERLAATGLQTLVFSTNSTRTLDVLPFADGLDVEYLATAGKPLRLRAYRSLPRPGVVLGDQVATDGVLARRLGFTFLHYCPDLGAIPPGPRLMRLLGRPIEALVFRRR